MQPIVKMQQAFASHSTVLPSATVEPSSLPIKGNKSETELQPSAPAMLPAKSPSMMAEKETSEIGLIGDAEAGANLTEILPTSSDSRRSS